jgi:hypothetical protein
MAPGPQDCGAGVVAPTEGRQNAANYNSLFATVKKSFDVSGPARGRPENREGLQAAAVVFFTSFRNASMKNTRMASAKPAGTYQKSCQLARSRLARPSRKRL